MTEKNENFCYVSLQIPKLTKMLVKQDQLSRLPPFPHQFLSRNHLPPPPNSISLIGGGFGKSFTAAQQSFAVHFVQIYKNFT